MDLLRRSVNDVTLDKKAIISNLARIVESVLTSGEGSGEQELRRLELEFEKLQARNDTIHDRFSTRASPRLTISAPKPVVKVK